MTLKLFSELVGQQCERSVSRFSKPVWNTKVFSVGSILHICKLQSAFLQHILSLPLLATVCTQRHDANNSACSGLGCALIK